jgi:hypothetical protein
MARADKVKFLVMPYCGKNKSKRFAYFSEITTYYENCFSYPQRTYSSNFNPENVFRKPPVVLLSKAAYD